MEILFKPTSELEADRTIEKTNFPKYYPNIVASTPFDALEPYIRNGVIKYVLKWLGDDFYNKLAKHINDGAEQEVLDTMKDSLQTAVANYAVYLAMPSMTNKMGAMGIVSETNNNTAPSSQWSYKTRRWDALLQADTAMDRLLGLMMKNIASNQLADWKKSVAYKDFQSDLFKHSSAFEKYAHISGHRAYVSLLPYVRKSEKKLKKILCGEWPKATEVSTDAAVLEFQDLCRSHVADTTMLIGIDHTAMTYDGNGWMLASSTDGYDSKVHRVSTFADGAEKLKEQLRVDLSETTDSMRSLLFDNPDIFTEWAEAHVESEPHSKIITPSDGVGGVML